MTTLKEAPKYSLLNINDCDKYNTVICYHCHSYIFIKIQDKKDINNSPYVPYAYRTLVFCYYCKSQSFLWSDRQVKIVKTIEI